MNKRIAFALIAALSACGAPELAPGKDEQALTITSLFTTGVDATGAALAGGAVDPHYKLAIGDATYPGPNTYVVTSPVWPGDTATAKWISVQASAAANTAVYTYSTTFMIPTGAVTSSASISGTWLCDDTCTVALNGTVIANPTAGYVTPSLFSIPTGSPFVVGTNTLTFAVNNSGGGVSGLLIQEIAGDYGTCAADTDCTGTGGNSNSWCDNLPATATCTAKTPNNIAVPGGSCTATKGTTNPGSIGSRACISGGCDTADNKCGIATGDTCANTAQCRTGVCSTTTLKCVTCQFDTDCSPGNYCTATNTCAAQGATNAAIPNGGTCTNGLSDRCLSGNCSGGLTPLCGAANGAGPCTAANEAGSGGATNNGTCQSGICDPAGNSGAGLCHVCTPAQPGACTVLNATSCSSTTFTCVTCNGDNASSATAVCPTAAKPYCPGAGGACTTCGTPGGATCTTTLATHAGVVCEPSGACANTCTVDSQCPAGLQFCDADTLTCTPDIVNGAKVPTETNPHNPTLNGTCPTNQTLSVCLSGVCDVTDNACGYADGDGSCTSTSGMSNSGTVVCRSMQCSSNGKCEKAGGCNVDADCAPGNYCNASNSCAAKAPTGSAIPTGGTCTSGASDQCLSGTCSGSTCGYANGSGPCTLLNEAGSGGATNNGTCQSGVCDPNPKGSAIALCEQCTALNATACAGTTPICDTTTDTCGACNGDFGTVATSACPTAAAPFCPGGGGACTTCGTAGSKTACGGTTATHAGTTCQVSGACSNACAIDSNCTTGSFCDTDVGTCMADIANGGAIPVEITHTNPTLNGTCPSGGVLSVCASGVCNGTLCGYPVGVGPCTSSSGMPTSGTVVCRSGACSSNGLCEPSGGCNVDKDCATGNFCSAGTCHAQAATGATIPLGATACSAANASNGCLSGTCSGTTCGYANGVGPCTTTDAAGQGGATNNGVCQSGICDGNGLCQQCTVTNATKCGTATPICDKASEICVACNGDNGTTATATCGATAPYCPGLGAACTTCGTAGSTTKCTAIGATHAGNTCFGNGACSNGCVSDANCIAGTQFCDTGAPVPDCIADIPNGQAVPNIPSHTNPTLNGLCPSSGMLSVCASGVCDTDNLCGFNNGDGTCTTGTAATVCRSTTCGANGKCVRMGGCNTDGDCTSTQWCDTTSSTCEAKAATGAAIPSSGTCANGASDRCLSGSCDSDNLCGHAAGKGPCTVATEAGDSGDCRTMLCDGNVCVQCTSSDTTHCATGTTCVADACVLGAPVIVEPANQSTLASGTTTISGTGTPGSVVTVSVDGTVVGTATVDSNGNWTLPTAQTLTPGEHTITAVATAGTGAGLTTSATTTVTVTVSGAVADMGLPAGARVGLSGGGLSCSAAPGSRPEAGGLACMLVLCAIAFGSRRRKVKA